MIEEEIQSKIQEAFKAGYHCQWIRSENRYIFDPLMKPGDPSGAYQAWLLSISNKDKVG